MKDCEKCKEREQKEAEQLKQKIEFLVDEVKYIKSIVVRIPWDIFPH